MKRQVTKLIKAIKYYLYYLKYYGKFMFLHKPICEKYKNESIFLFNRFYVCRSCFYLYTGALTALLYTLNYPVMSKAFLGLTVFIIFLSKPSVYLSFSRSFRDIIRFLDGAVASALITSSFMSNIWLGVSICMVLYAVKTLFNRERDASKICSGCTELNEGRACSGYKEQMKALLNLEEEFCKTLTLRKEMLL